MKLLFFFWSTQVYAQNCSESGLEAFIESKCDLNVGFGCDRENKENCAQECMARSVSFESS